jgi:hypothetical protein
MPYAALSAFTPLEVAMGTPQEWGVFAVVVPGMLAPDLLVFSLLGGTVAASLRAKPLASSPGVRGGAA